MASVRLDNVSVEFPFYDVGLRSIRKQVLEGLTIGGGLTWLYEGNLPIEDTPGAGGGVVNGKYSNVSLYIFSLYFQWH